MGELDKYAGLGSPPRHVRRLPKERKPGSLADLVATQAEAAIHFVHCERRFRDFEEVFQAIEQLTDWSAVLRTPDKEIGGLIVKLRWLIYDCDEATYARAAFLEANEAVPEEERGDTFIEKAAEIRLLPPIDTEPLLNLLRTLEKEAATREAERKEARRKPPREPEPVVEVPPVVIDTTCSCCHRERHFVIEGVSYCKRHVPPHLRPHGRI